MHEDGNEIPTVDHDDAAVVSGDGNEGGARPRRRWLRWVAGIAGVFAAGAAVAGVVAYREVNKTLAPEYTDIAYSVPTAPQMTPAADETIYRIEGRSSSFAYTVDEKMFARTTRKVTGTTNGIAGDFAINTKDPSASRVGTIVVNVEQLTSDNNLRDARVRKGYLESAKYPTVELQTLALAGLPADSFIEGKTYSFTIDTAATIRDKLVPLTWSATASVKDGVLTAKATVDTKMSVLGVGPITIAGLVSTSDDITLTVAVKAFDPSRYDIATTIAAPPSVERTGDGPSYDAVIKPILLNSCASCHNSGEVGAKHWEFETAGDAAAVADGIGEVVEGRYMPPWPASNAGVPLSHSKTLSENDVSQIVAWAKAGGPLDIDPSTPMPAPEPKAGTQPRADRVLRMSEPYLGIAAQTNDYRCFVFDPKITEPMYLTGFDVTPDQREQVHHVQIFHADATQAARGKAMEGQDGRPGWSCFGTGSLGAPGRGAGNEEINGFKRRPNFSVQPGLIAGWVPGQDPVIFPQKSGVLMMPGDKLVFQAHYHYAQKPKPDASFVSIQLDKATRSITPIDIVNPLAPVEIPCPPGATNPLCDRNAALAEVTRLYGGSGAGTANGLHALCGTSPAELAARTRNGVSFSECTESVPEDGRIVSVFGHMHTLGKSFRMTLNPGEKTEKVLLDIPTWNFNWQMNYELQEPIRVKAGQKLKIECSWDRATDPNRKQRYIVFAEGTEDEMCFATYAILPDDS